MLALRMVMAELVAFVIPDGHRARHLAQGKALLGRSMLIRVFAASLVLAMVVPMTTNHDALAADSADSSGTSLVSESFGGTQVASSRFIPLGDACLTNASRNPIVDPANGTQIKGCSKTNKTPGITPDPTSGGWLQLTDTTGNTSGGVVYNQAIPAQYGVDITFDQAQYGGSGADGIGFFLTDGSYNLTKTGATGGSMGYAPKIGTGSTDALGAVGGFIGLALDRYGNFQRAAEGRGQGCAAAGENPGIAGNIVPNSVTLRGPGGKLLADGTRDKDWSSGYCLLDTKKLTDVNPGATLASGTSNPVSVHITVTAPDANNSAVVTVQLKMSGESDYTTYLTTTVPNVPSSYKLGFSGATGGLNDVHLIRNLDIKTIRTLPTLSLVKQVDSSSPNAKSVYDSGDTVPYSFVVTNGSIETLNSIAVHDDKVSDISCVATTLAPNASTTCTGSHVLTAAEAANGSFRNEATATGTDVDGATITSNPSEVVVPTTVNNSFLQCTAGAVYSLNGDGNVYKVTSSGYGSSLFDFGSGTWNALGISEGGQYAYAAQRNTNNNATIARRDLSNGVTTTLATVGLGFGSSYLVAGAVDLQTGRYVFGGPGSSGRMQLLAFDPSNNSTKAIGYIAISGQTNGDLAFDALGNLYLVTSSSGTNHMYRVDASTMGAAYAGAANANRQLATVEVAQPTTNWPTNTGADALAVNGIAFQTDGKVFLGNNASIYVSDLTSWSRDTQWSVASGSSDLASCASPPTIKLQKDVKSRYNDSDQFSLSLTRTDVSSNTALGSATTSGTDTGIQNTAGEFVDPKLTASGQMLSFAETGAGGANLTNYDTSWSCKDDSGQTVINASGDGGSGSLAVPKPASWATGLDLVCTITNTAKPHPATVTIEKSIQDVNGNQIATTDFDGNQVKQGWPMAVALSDNAPAGVQISGDTVQNTDQNGKVSGWTVTFPSGVAQTSVDVTETQGSLQGYAFDNLQCQVNSDSFESVSATQGTGANTNKVTGAVDVAPGDAVICIFTNRQQPGSVTWSKVADDSSRTKLAGSQWQLTYPDGSAKTIKDYSESGSNNIATAGDTYGFKVSDLPWGTYILVETKAPTGYVLPDENLPANQHTFTVSGASGLEENFSDPFINRQQTVPDLPLTGGTSSDSFLIGGIAVLALSGVAGFIAVKRRKGKAKG
jgi:LPXTG-motif cell wall-anchored protein